MRRKKQSGTCFVAMPFSEEMNAVYERIYDPVIRYCGLTPLRVDGIFRAGLITKDIFDCISSCTIVLADLTGANPNVYYELGVAHRERKPVILTAQHIGADVRFDVRQLRVIEYSRGSDDFWADKLRESLQKAITETLTEPAGAIATPWLGLSGSHSGGQSAPIGMQIQRLLDLVISQQSMITQLLEARVTWPSLTPQDGQPGLRGDHARTQKDISELAQYFRAVLADEQTRGPLNPGGKPSAAQPL